MQTLTVQPNEESSAIVPCRPLRVYIDGRRRRDLRVVSWEIEAAPSFGMARLAADDSLSGARSPDFTDPLRLPAVGREVLLRPALDFGYAEFRGVVIRHQLHADAEGETLLAEVSHRLAEALRDPILGRWEWTASGPHHLRDKPLQFNLTRDSLAGPAPRSIRGRLAPLFETTIDARRWTVGNALAYLLAAHAPTYVAAPEWDELVALAGNVDLGEFDATGMNLADVLAQVAQRGGLEVRSAREGLALVVYRPGQDGRRMPLLLQRPGQMLQFARSNLTGGRIVLARRASRRPLRVLGGFRRYEATFELQPGWNSETATDRWRDTVRGEDDAWQNRERIYRRWVLNEHGRYDTLSTFDLAALGADDFLVQKPRRFLPCVSTDTQGRSPGVVVEYRLTSEGVWRRWPSALWVAEDECAVTFDGNALPGDYFAAAVAGTAQVRVTACVLADTRIEAWASGDPGLAAELHDWSGRAQWWAVHPTSRFFAAQGSQAQVLRDDTNMLEAFLRRRRDDAARATRAEVTLGWIDTSCHVGDVAQRVDGRMLELVSQPLRPACVVSVRHDFDRDHQTHLVLEG